MIVTLHSVTIWKELHGKQVKVVDASCPNGWLALDVDIGDTPISPALPTTVLRGLTLVADVSQISKRAIGVIAIGNKVEAWEIIMEKLRRCWEQQEKAYFAKHGKEMEVW